MRITDYESVNAVKSIRRHAARRLVQLGRATSLIDIESIESIEYEKITDIPNDDNDQPLNGRIPGNPKTVRNGLLREILAKVKDGCITLLQRARNAVLRSDNDQQPD